MWGAEQCGLEHTTKKTMLIIETEVLACLPALSIIWPQPAPQPYLPGPLYYNPTRLDPKLILLPGWFFYHLAQVSLPSLLHQRLTMLEVWLTSLLFLDTFPTTPRSPPALSDLTLLYVHQHFVCSTHRLNVHSFISLRQSEDGSRLIFSDYIPNL